MTCTHRADQILMLHSADNKQLETKLQQKLHVTTMKYLCLIYLPQMGITKQNRGFLVA